MHMSCMDTYRACCKPSALCFSTRTMFLSKMMWQDLIVVSAYVIFSTEGSGFAFQEIL